MKIALAQINPKVGDIDSNLRKVLECISQAKKNTAHWILFPELALVGYPPRDLLEYHRFYEENCEALEKVKEASMGIGVVMGALDKNDTGKGKPFFNTAFVFSDQKLVFKYAKRLLPSYDIFEDERFFEKGTHPGIFELKGEKFAVAICEDIWNHKGFLPHLYEDEPLSDLKNQNPKALFVLSASPFELGKPQVREKLLSKVAVDLSAPVFYCNQVAGNDELIFDGCSLVSEKSGTLVAKLPAFEETLQFCEPHQGLQSRWPQTESEWLVESLVFGIREYLKKSSQKKICLGLSGGIDSSVAAVLAEKAVGKENVLGVGLPTQFTSSQSREDAVILAKNLGISYREVDIDPLYRSFCEVLKTLGPSGLTLENIQPRIRMTVLMAVSNQEGRLLINTSNKSEIAAGYSTLYGDSAGALAPLGDLLKGQVVKLAQHFNQASELIPQRVMIRPPTAELRPNQKDEDSLPPYDVLDPLVDACLSESLGPAELNQQGFPEKWVDLFSRLHRISEYKRRQMPPVLRVSKKAFGMGRRMPLACRNYADK